MVHASKSQAIFSAIRRGSSSHAKFHWAWPNPSLFKDHLHSLWTGCPTPLLIEFLCSHKPLEEFFVYLELDSVHPYSSRVFQWYHECGKRCQTKKQRKQATHHIMTPPFLMIPRVWQEVSNKWNKQNKQLIMSQATHHVMTLPCMVSSKLNQKPSILDVEFFIDAWWKLAIHLIWADECAYVIHTIIQGWAKNLSPKSSTYA